VMPVGYSSAAAELRIYSTHLKASQGFESQRLAEATGIRDSMNAMPPGTHAFVTGDFNVYTNTEGAYLAFLASQANDVGRCVDLLPAGVWHDGGSFAAIHTQSTCLSGCSFGEATGGMDDRFDFMLPTANLATGQGLACIPGTMVAVGQDGHHLNQSITAAPTIPEGAAYAAALLGTSDHLPVRVDLQVPAKLALDTSPIAFGTVIVGAPASVDRSISNPASPPADALDCGYAPPVGCSAAGPASVAAGVTGTLTVTLDTSVPAARSGNLTLTTDAPDTPVASVALSGMVLDHAQVSLDADGSDLARTLDFGDHPPGEFTALPASVYDLDYTSLRARLSVTGATITGGDGRFSIAGFAPTLVAGTPASWDVSFDDAGAAAGTYAASLAFDSADEPLPGAAAQPQAVYTLRATVAAGSPAAVGNDAPASLSFAIEGANPVTGVARFRLGLPAPAPVDAVVFDATGRRVASLAHGVLGAGHHSLVWRGDAAPGIYFAVLRTGGVVMTRRVARVR